MFVSGLLGCQIPLAKTLHSQILSGQIHKNGLPETKEPTKHYKILSSNKKTLQLYFSFEKPEVVEKDNALAISSKTSSFQVPGTEYPVPYFSYPLLGKVISAKIINHNNGGVISGIDLDPLQNAYGDTPIGLESESDLPLETSVQGPSTNTNTPLHWNYVGSMRGKNISYLHLYPYRYDSHNESLVFDTSYTVEITFNSSTDRTNYELGLNHVSLLDDPTPFRPNKSIDKKLNLKKNLSSLSSTSLQTSLSSSAVFGSLPVIPKYKMVVDEDGVYKIGFFEFQDAEFPDEFFEADPRTFRIFNKGVEIPIFVSGASDGQFDRNDFIEFIGESHKIGLKDPDRPDMYNDPYTDENIYYFYWETAFNDSNAGLRMVEVPAQIRRQISPQSSFNLKGRSFRSSLHFEKNNTVRERLSGFYSRYNQEDYVKTRNHTDSRDISFWTDVEYGRSYTFDITIPSPDFSVSIDPESLRVRAAFHGLSIVNLNGQPQNTALVALGKATSPFIVTETSWGTKVYSNRNLSRQELNVVDVKLPITQQRLLDESGSAVIQITNRDNINIGTSSRSFYFNWLNLTYRRLYEAYQDELAFTAPPSSRPGLYQFQINGFTTPSVDIYKVGVGKLSNFSVEKYTQVSDNNIERTRYRIVFQDNVINPEDVEYIALPSDQKKIPSAFIEVEPANVFEPENALKNTANNYNYIIITSSKFINQETKDDNTNPVTLYRDYRSQTLPLYNEPNNILVTTVEGIYDEFNNGIKSPHAIRDFLSYAYHNWATSPSYVLLLGDASRANESQDIVPTMHIQTLRFGATGADVWFTMVDGIDDSGRLDLLPEMQISRVPAKSLTDISTYLTKLENYEKYLTDPANAPLGEWQNKIVFVAGETGSESIGSQGVRNDVFVIQTDNLIENYIQRNFFINRLHTNLGRNAVSSVTYPDVYRGSRSNMEQYLNEGCLILNFIGHGGGAIWSDSQVMTLDGVDRLNNFNALPFVTSMTCFTGAFDDPGYSAGTLAEKMILTPEKGAIGFIGSSGLGWLVNDDIMTRSIFNFLLDDENKDLSIGDLLFRAKTTYYLDNINFWDQAPSMIYQYGIFGDPALRLAYPKSKTLSGENELSYDLKTHILAIDDTLTFTCEVNSINTGIVRWQLTDSYNFDTELNPNNILFVQSNRMLQNADGRLTDTIRIPIKQPIEVAKNNSSLFRGGQIKFYIQGAGNSLGKTVHGFIPFSANGPYIVNVEPQIPIQNAVDLPLDFTANIDFKSGIRSAYLRITIESLNPNLEYEPVSGWNNKLITATQISPGIFKSTSPIPASLMRKGNKLTYDFIAQNTNYNIAYSDVQTAIVGELPDLAAYPKAKPGMLQFFENSSIDFYPDANSVVIGAQIYNWSGQRIDNAKVYFYENSIRNGDPRKSSFQNLNIPVLIDNNIIGSTTISVDPNQVTLAKIPVPSGFKFSETYSIGVKIVSDTSNASFEETYTNNLSNARDIIYDLVWIDNSTTQNIALDQSFNLNIPSGSFSKSGFFRVTKNANPGIIAQPDNQFIRFKDQRSGGLLVDENYYSYDLQPLDTAFYLKKPILATISFDALDERFIDDPTRRDNVGAYFYATNLERWIKVSDQNRLDSATFETDISKLGTYSVLYSSDQTNPIANLGLEGQYYTPGSFAPKKARIVATLQDQNGINLDPAFITVVRDGDSSQAVQSKLTIPLSTLNANNVGISYDDDFEPGPHEVTFIFHDTNLNQTRSETMQFVVETQYGLKVFGNFPNPFTDETDIAYEILVDGGASVLEFKIYTVSGRLITTFNQQSGKVLGFTPTQVTGSDNDARTFGLHIFRWDGTDMNGNPVANGVYFCKIKASFRGNIQEDIIKIARIR